MASVLDSGTEGPEQPRRCRVTVLGKLFSHPSCLYSPSSEIGSSPLKGCEGNCRPGCKYWQLSVRFMTHATCRLSAKNRDQLWNPTLGNRSWAAFIFYLYCSSNDTHFCWSALYLNELNFGLFSWDSLHVIFWHWSSLVDALWPFVASTRSTSFTSRYCEWKIAKSFRWYSSAIRLT